MLPPDEPDRACPYPAGVTGNMSCIIAGSAYYVRGIDLASAERSRINGACSAASC